MRDQTYATAGCFSNDPMKKARFLTKPGFPLKSIGKLSRFQHVSRLNRLDDDSRYFVWIGSRVRATIFQPAFPAAFYRSDRDTDRCTTVRHTVRELRDRLGFVLTGQTQVVISAVYVDMFFDNFR